MNGFIGRLLGVLGSGGILAGTVGCNHPDLVDPCYPERYQYASRQNVHASFAPQVRNGHVLDQTVWNYHFEEGTDKLTLGGQAHLAYLARRRPAADPCIFLQTAQEIVYNAAKPDEFVKQRTELDLKRVVAVKKYLQAVTAGGVAPDFEVYVHNPPEVGMAGAQADPAIRQLYSTPRATLPGTGGSGGGSGGSR